MIMEICKVPTLWLKVLNKHSITHIMYIEMENVIRKTKHNMDINKGSSITMQNMHACTHTCMHTHAHTHTHTLHRLIG